MKLDIWSDIACPWCYIGKRRLEAALRDFPHADAVEVTWHSFELDPEAPTEREGDYVTRLAEKYGTPRDQAQTMIDRMTETAAGDGLDFRFDIARPGNTFDAHRLLHLARDRGLQDAVKERFFRAYLTEGEPIGDPSTLARLPVDAGLDAGEVAAVLEGDKYADDVRGDERQAMAYGITGVPTFVFESKYAVSGAQPAALLREVLDKVWTEANPLTFVDSGAAGTCDGDSCAV